MRTDNPVMPRSRIHVNSLCLRLHSRELVMAGRSRGLVPGASLTARQVQPLAVASEALPVLRVRPELLGARA